VSDPIQFTIDYQYMQIARIESVLDRMAQDMAVLEDEKAERFEKIGKLRTLAQLAEEREKNPPEIQTATAAQLELTQKYNKLAKIDVLLSYREQLHPARVEQLKAERVQLLVEIEQAGAHD
jgi:hypothetical protein